MRDRVEVALQVGVDDVRVAALSNSSTRRSASLHPRAGAKAVAVLGEVALEDRFQHHPQRRLDHPVANRRNPQRPLLLLPGLGM